MERFAYVAILAGCTAVSVILDVVLRLRVYARWRRLVAAVIPVAVVFTGWDLFAVSRHEWSFTRRWISGLQLASRLPIEEFVFFVVVPICAVATYEAVRHYRPDWRFGDEAGSR
jgi:lycopene cyclase domain-containing protein